MHTSNIFEIFTPMRTRSILFRHLELQTGRLIEGTAFAFYYDGADPFAWHYGPVGDLTKDPEEVANELDAKLDAEFPYTMYELWDGDRQYRTTDVTEMAEFCRELGRLGDSKDVTRINWQIKLQRENIYPHAKGK